MGNGLLVVNVREPVEKIIKKYVPDKHVDEAISEARVFTFNLAPPNKPQYQAKQLKNKRLTAKTKRNSGVYKINRTGQVYSQYLPLHELWKQYIDNLLQLHKLRDYNCETGDPRSEQISLKMSRADLHGSEMSVTASTCPSYVNTRGIVLQETKHTFILITPENLVRTVPKAHSEFTVHIGEYTVII